VRTVPDFVTAVHLRELPRVPDAFALVRTLRPLGLPWLLESALIVPGIGRFSFAGADPYAVLRVRGRDARIEGRRAVHPGVPVGTSQRVGDPLELVRSLLPPAPASITGVARCSAPFIGGAVGSWGYELAAEPESIAAAVDDPNQAAAAMADLTLLLVDRLVAIDHLEARAWVIGTGFGPNVQAAAARAAEACTELAARAEDLPAAPTRVSSVSQPGSLLAPEPEGVCDGFDARSYARAVSRIRDEIAAGNVYQANLSHRMELAVPGIDPLALYGALRELNPAPFAAYLELPEAAVVSSSPERFLRLDPDRRVESRPIKGTRPRGAHADADRSLARDLRESEKDRAENLMIVDLVRNDLGRVCETGSIEVPELMTVESYATVHQLVSTVTGRLLADRDAMDLLRASFPPGSMTGAPKRAAMQVIDRLEPVRRGPYAGGLGYLDLRGGLDLSVVIRTIVVADGRARLHVGGAVVIDSDPDAEWRETLDKARALLAALGRVAPRLAAASEARRDAVPRGG
jgi:para-aminobenzoate synthetase component 1